MAKNNNKLIVGIIVVILILIIGSGFFMFNDSSNREIVIYNCNFVPDIDNFVWSCEPISIEGIDFISIEDLRNYGLDDSFRCDGSMNFCLETIFERLPELAREINPDCNRLKLNIISDQEIDLSALCKVLN